MGFEARADISISQLEGMGDSTPKGLGRTRPQIIRSSLSGTSQEKSMMGTATLQGGLMLWTLGFVSRQLHPCHSDGT